MNRATIALALSLLVLPGAASAQGTGNLEPRVVLKGYDAVAYFTEQKPVKGTPEYRQDFDGARYHFSSARHRDAFAADPDRYAPQFAGLCAAALSMGNTYEADPTAWKIVDGKLYVFRSQKGLEMAEKDPTILARSRENWRASR